MVLDSLIPVLGPVVVFCNISIMFLCLRVKRTKLFSLSLYAVVFIVLHILTLVSGIAGTFIVRYLGILFLPVNLLIFKGQTFQKVFAFFMLYQITALPTHLADAIVGVTIGYQSPYARFLYFSLSLLMLGIYMTVALRYGRRLFERMFVDGRRSVWILCSFGAIFSFLFVLSTSWTEVGAVMYFGLMLFILWSFGVLCYAIINTHEKAAQAYHTETLLLQMNAMHEQAEAERKHREDMEILRHDMRHEMGVIMELFRSGKTSEAETVCADWRNSLNEAVPALICTEPVLNAVFTRFIRKSDEKNIRLDIISDISSALPFDTARLSVIVSNALENALAAADNITEQDKRIIQVKLIQSGRQLGLEIINPCSEPVEMNERGIPVTHKEGHGIGIRSILSFAEENGYLTDFIYQDFIFTFRLVMSLND